MIDQLYVALQQADESPGLAFARENALGCELACFSHHNNLEHPNLLISQMMSLSCLRPGSKLILLGPHADLNPVSDDPVIAEHTAKRYSQIVQLAIKLKSQGIIIRSAYTKLIDLENATQPWTEKTVDFWRRFITSPIGQELSDNQLTIYLENRTEPRPEILGRVISGIDHPNFKICLDVGQVNLFSPISALEWMDKLGHNLGYIKAYNSRGKTMEYLALNEGDIDMEAFLNHAIMVPQKFHLAIHNRTPRGLYASLRYLDTFLALQEQLHTSRSFLI